MQHVYIVDDEANLRDMLSRVLQRHGFRTTPFEGAEPALAALKHERPDCVLCDIRMPGMDGMELLRRIRQEGLEVTVIMMSAFGDVDTAVEAMKLGAYDYVSKPFKPDEIVLALRKAAEREALRQENRRLTKVVESRADIPSIVTGSDEIRRIFELIRKLHGFSSPVLIQGESGTGKELIARAIHQGSDRAERSFVGVNCGAIPETLMESELFGHMRGSFTDARSETKGLFEEADGGTLFLDEIGELPLQLQVKLLRALQEGEIRKIGAVKSIPVDVRIISATIHDLAELVAARRFREDLYYRLNVIAIRLPPLRERPGDVPILADHFRRSFNRSLGLQVKGFTPEVMAAFERYPWPGNVRELENAVERSMILCEGDLISEQSLPARLVEAVRKVPAGTARSLSIKKESARLERELISEALRQTKGNRTAASKVLEISHRALLYKIKQYGIEG